jgi:hypothetical protein
MNPLPHQLLAVIHAEVEQQDELIFNGYYILSMKTALHE